MGDLPKALHDGSPELVAARDKPCQLPKSSAKASAGKASTYAGALADSSAGLGSELQRKKGGAAKTAEVEHENVNSASSSDGNKYTLALTAFDDSQKKLPALPGKKAGQKVLKSKDHEPSALSKQGGSANEEVPLHPPEDVNRAEPSKPCKSGVNKKSDKKKQNGSDESTKDAECQKGHKGKSGKGEKKSGNKSG